MNHLEGVTKLQHEYYVMRHGFSEANKLGLIVSDGINGYGLTPEGKEEVRESIKNTIFNDVRFFTEPIVVFSSPFKRTQDTANLVQKSLYSAEIFYHSSLRERFFGRYERKSVDNYPKVWEDDLRSITERKSGIEPVDQVRGRMTGFIKNIENGRFKKFQGETKKIMIISHGDPLHILGTVFEGLDPAQHRSLPPLKTGEIRKLEWKNQR